MLFFSGYIYRMKKIAYSKIYSEALKIKLKYER